jgi:hypothetical protein
MSRHIAKVASISLRSLLRRTGLSKPASDTICPKRLRKRSPKPSSTSLKPS